MTNHLFKGYGRLPYDQLLNSRRLVDFTQENYARIYKELIVMDVYSRAYRKKTSAKRKKAKNPLFIEKVVSLDRVIVYIDRLLFEEQQQVEFAKVATKELAYFAYRTTSKFVSDIKKLMKIDKNIKVKKTDLTYSSSW